MPRTRLPKRTRDDLASDLAIVLRPDLPLHVRTRRRFITVILRKYTEAAGKYRGERYWSREALAMRGLPRAKRSNRLVHEHAIPLNLLQTQLATLAETREVPKAECAEILERAAVGVVVTNEQDKHLERDSLPGGERTLEELLRADWRARYAAAGIDVVDTQAAGASETG